MVQETQIKLVSIFLSFKTKIEENKLPLQLDQIYIEMCHISACCDVFQMLSYTVYTDLLNVLFVPFQELFVFRNITK